MEFTTNQQMIRTAELLKTETAEHSLESELILPDSYGDIGRILKCKGEPLVLSTTVSGQTATVEGVVSLQLLYVNTEGDICFYSQSLPFYHECAVPDGTTTTQTTATMDYCNCRCVNTRKVEIRGAVGMKIEWEQLRDLFLITDAVGGGVQLKRQSARVSTLVGTLQKSFGVTDEIGVDMGSIHTLLRCKGFVRETEYKIISGRIVTKGILEICSLYRDTQGRYCPLQAKLPFSQVLDMEGVDPDCHCSLSFRVTALELRPRTGLDGECKTLLVNATLQVEAKGVKTLEIPMVTDGFSTTCGLNMRKHNGDLQEQIETVEETAVCKKQMDVGREIGSVVDVWCDIASHRVQQDQNKIVVSGIVNACALLLDSDGLPLYTEKAIDFSWEYTPKNWEGALTCHPTLTVTDLSYSIHGEAALDLRIHLAVNAPIYGILPLHPVVDLEIDSSVEAPCCPAPLVVYFAKAGEPIFQIARKYSTTVDAILEANNLTEPCAPGGALLVPACKE